MMTYKDALTSEMDKLAQNPRVRFVGYNIAYGPRMHGTLCNVPIDKCIETPVTENLMCGIAMGLALEGFIPVLCFERMDFCIVAADALINHIGGLQHYGLILPMIIRVCIGNDQPLDPGIQHKQEYLELFALHADLKLTELRNSDCERNWIKYWYNKASKANCPVMLVERKEFYEQDIIAE